MQEGMPNSLNSIRSSKPGNGSHAASAAAPAQSGQDDPYAGSEMMPSGSRRMASASSSDSDANREAELSFVPAAVPNLPADQHALNDLRELHSRAGVAVGSPSISGSGRRAPPSRASSWGSSRAGSALPRINSKLASTPEADAETDQLTLHGMSLI